MGCHAEGMPAVLTILVLLALATYRVTRFAIHDTLIDEPRTAVLRWLASKPGIVRSKLHDLATCPYCLSVWVAGALTAATAQVATVQLPLLMWLAVAGGAMVAWRFVEL